MALRVPKLSETRPGLSASISLAWRRPSGCGISRRFCKAPLPGPLLSNSFAPARSATNIHVVSIIRFSLYYQNHYFLTNHESGAPFRPIARGLAPLLALVLFLAGLLGGM